MTPNVVEDIIKQALANQETLLVLGNTLETEGYVVINDKGDVITVVPAKKKNRMNSIVSNL